MRSSPAEVAAGTVRAPAPSPVREALLGAGRRVRGLTGSLLVLPGAFWLILFFFVPLGYIAVYSVATNVDFAVVRFGFDLQNFSDALSTPGLVSATLRAALYAGLAALLDLVIAYPLAYWIVRRGGRYKNFLVVLIMLPFFSSYLIRVFAWVSLLRNEGVINTALQGAGLLDGPIELLGTPFAVVLVLAYDFLPFMILPLYVALERLDPALLEASKDLGGTKLVTFWSVTWPLSMPGVVAGMLLVFVPALGDFVTPELVGGLNTQVIGQNVYRQFLSFQNYPLGSALAFILMAISLVAAIVITRVLGREAT
jgi:spermidine/putrescine transport system permease protein